MADHSATAGSRSIDAYLTSNVFDLFSLKDRVVVITGGARGIGLALGFAVAEAGAIPVMIDVNDHPHEHFHLLQKMCSKTQLYVSDVTNYESLQATFAEIVNQFGRIDSCITAAGICPDQPFLERDPAGIRRCLDINVLGTYFTAQLAAKQMVKQERRPSSSGRGSIMMIASMAAHRHTSKPCSILLNTAQKRDTNLEIFRYLSDYAASKGAVLSLVRDLGVELAEHEIRVNCISPGYIMTDMTLDLAKEIPGLAAIQTGDPPMKRMGDRTDLKGAAVYLLSDASAYMTGGEMLITGGLHAA